EKFEMLRAVMMWECGPSDLRPYLITPKGSLRVIEIALNKAGINGEAATKFTDSLSAVKAEYLASLLCGLFDRNYLTRHYDLPPQPAEPNAAKPVTFSANAPGASTGTFGNPPQGQEPPAAASVPVETGPSIAPSSAAS